MISKTRGIVLHRLKYTDSSLIVKIYTEGFGLQSYLLKGARSKKSPFKANLFQPLALVDLVVHSRENKGLQAVKELKANPFASVNSDIRKSAIILFLNEVLYKILKQEQPEPELFSFIYNSLLVLDETEEGFINFHLIFLVKLSKYLGFPPAENAVDYSYFNLKEGVFAAVRPEDTYLAPPLSTAFSRLIKINFETTSELRLSNSLRRDLLSALLDYYALHVPGFKDIKSHHVLNEVLED